MKFRPTRSEDPELNLVPLIDVLLMTLIFLIVTTSFSKEAQLHIKLPQASARTTVANDQTLRVAIDAQGRYFINDKQLLRNTLEVLSDAMVEAAGGRKDPVIIVRADQNTPYQAVVRVMDAARRLGYTHLTFATQQPLSGGPAP
jgi:biopolymer transport protein ExbD